MNPNRAAGSRRAGWLGLLAGLGLAIGPLLAGPARAVIPSAHKIADAVAAENRTSKRAAPLLLEVTLSIGDREAVAAGVLASHPTGLARLELTSRAGFTERHLLQGESYTASRDGVLLDGPRPFLPPVFLMQATSGAALSAALTSFGVRSDQAVLGRVDDYDCYVLGGRSRGTPGFDGFRGGEEPRRPSVWIDLDTFSVVQVDRRDGVRFRFGPIKQFDGIRAPSWIQIDAPDQPPSRLDIQGVGRANAPAAAFGTDWLMAPANPGAASTENFSGSP